MPRKSLGHLAATGVAAAEKQGSFRILLRGDSGQKHAHSGALVDGAFDLELAAMSLNDVLYDSETQSRAAQFAGTRFVDAVEALGEPRQVLFRNPCAGIDDCDFNLRVCFSAGMGVCGRDHDRAASGCVLHRIIDEVEQDLHERVAVEAHGGDACFEIEPQREPRALDVRSDERLVAIVHQQSFSF